MIKHSPKFYQAISWVVMLAICLHGFAVLRMQVVSLYADHMAPHYDGQPYSAIPGADEEFTDPEIYALHAYPKCDRSLAHHSAQCSSCSICCLLMLLATNFIFPTFETTLKYPAIAPRLFIKFLTDRLERPPRSTLV